MQVHDTLAEALARIARRVFAVSTRGSVRYDRPRYLAGDTFVFGCETRGLPEEALASVPHRRLRLPMRPGNRNLNLSNAVAVVAFEPAPAGLRRRRVSCRPHAVIRTCADR